MRAHIFQHIWFEDSGTIAEILAERGFAIGVTRFDRGETPPPIEGIDLLVIMGGFMSVNDEAEFPWLIDEKRFVRAAIAHGVKVLGVCLGAQMIASALGAKVYKNSEKEIGWHEVFAVDQRGAAPCDRACENGDRGLPSEGGADFLPPKALVFHWHGESFELPLGATLLASSAACKNQAFAIGSQVVGLQFHLETTPRTARLLVENCRDELAAQTRYIQSEREILNAPDENYAAIKRIMQKLLSFLCA